MFMVAIILLGESGEGKLEWGLNALYLSVSVKVSRRIGGRKKSHAFRIQINAREMHENLLKDFVTCELVTD